MDRIGGVLSSDESPLPFTRSGSLAVLHRIYGPHANVDTRVPGDAVD